MSPRNIAFAQTRCPSCAGTGCKWVGRPFSDDPGDVDLEPGCPTCDGLGEVTKTICECCGKEPVVVVFVEDPYMAVPLGAKCLELSGANAGVTTTPVVSCSMVQACEVAS